MVAIVRRRCLRPYRISSQPTRSRRSRTSRRSDARWRTKRFLEGRSSPPRRIRAATTLLRIAASIRIVVARWERHSTTCTIGHNLRFSRNRSSLIPYWEARRVTADSSPGNERANQANRTTMIQHGPGRLSALAQYDPGPKGRPTPKRCDPCYSYPTAGRRSPLDSSGAFAKRTVPVETAPSARQAAGTRPWPAYRRTGHAVDPTKFPGGTLRPTLVYRPRPVSRGPLPRRPTGTERPLGAVRAPSRPRSFGPDLSRFVLPWVHVFYSVHAQILGALSSGAGGGCR